MYGNDINDLFLPLLKNIYAFFMFYVFFSVSVFVSLNYKGVVDICISQIVPVIQVLFSFFTCSVTCSSAREPAFTFNFKFVGQVRLCIKFAMHFLLFVFSSPRIFPLLVSFLASKLP